MKSTVTAGKIGSRRDSLDPRPIHWAIALLCALLLLGLLTIIFVRPGEWPVANNSPTLPANNSLLLQLQTRVTAKKTAQPSARPVPRTGAEPIARPTTKPATKVTRTSDIKAEPKSKLAAKPRASNKERRHQKPPKPKAKAQKTPIEIARLPETITPPVRPAITQPNGSTELSDNDDPGVADSAYPANLVDNANETTQLRPTPSGRATPRRDIGTGDPVAVNLSSSQNLAALSATEKSAYRQRLVERITAAKRYPAMAARQRLEGEVVLRFAISRDGGLLTPIIETSSGHLLLDNAALAMLNRAAPLPPPPPGFKPSDLRFTIPVGFELN